MNKIGQKWISFFMALVLVCSLSAVALAQEPNYLTWVNTSWKHDSQEEPIESFTPDMLGDLDENTSWLFQDQFMDKSCIDFSFSGPVSIQQIIILNGFRGDPNFTYAATGQVKKITFSFRYAGAQDFTDPKIFNLPPESQDGAKWQRCDLGNVANVEALRLQVNEVYPSNSGDGISGIGEIRFVGR